MKRTVDVPKKPVVEEDFSSSEDEDDISVATGLCKSYKDCVRWRGNRLFSFCGTTKVCALCLTSIFNANDEKTFKRQNTNVYQIVFTLYKLCKVKICQKICVRLAKLL